MSFAKDAKNQILKNQINKNCCSKAFLSGVFYVSGEYDEKENVLSFTTDIPQLHDYCNKIIKSCYGDTLSFSMSSEFKINTTTYYRIKCPPEQTEELMNDLGLFDEFGEFNKRKINDKVVKEECCIRAFVKGVFVGCGTSGIRLSEKQEEKTSSGYDIEFIARSRSFLLDFSNLLAQFDITKRRSSFVLYIKESAMVCDLLALVEAYDSVLQLQNELAIRELRNKVNRQTNCMSANINKTVEASMKQIEAIQTVIDEVGLESLSYDLQEVALLRLANPEESLGELLNLATFPITKSGLNHRLNKIIKIANQLK